MFTKLKVRSTPFFRMWWNVTFEENVIGEVFNTLNAHCLAVNTATLLIFICT